MRIVSMMNNSIIIINICLDLLLYMDKLPYWENNFSQLMHLEHLSYKKMCLDKFTYFFLLCYGL